MRAGGGHGRCCPCRGGEPRVVRAQVRGVLGCPTGVPPACPGCPLCLQPGSEHRRRGEAAGVVGSRFSLEPRLGGTQPSRGPRCPGTDVPLSSGDRGDPHEAHRGHRAGGTIPVAGPWGGAGPDPSPGPSPGAQHRLWGSQRARGPLTLHKLGGLGARWGLCGSREPPPSLSPLSPHMLKDRSGPFLPWEPGLNAGPCSQHGAGPVGVGAGTIKLCFFCKPLDLGGLFLAGGRPPLPNTPELGGSLQPWMCCGAEHPRGLTGTLGGVLQSCPPPFLFLRISPAS